MAGRKRTNPAPKESKAALITGASKRVGAALALALAAEGYDIALHYHTSKKEAEALKTRITKTGVRCELLQGDLADDATLKSLVGKAKKAFPHLCVLINNASVFKRVTFMESNMALFDQQMAVNARAPVFLTQAFAKTVTRGHVINLLDADVVKHHGSHFMYLLSKKTLAAFTLMAARDLPHIQVNAICPGGLLPSSENPKDYETKLLARLPIKLLPKVRDVIESIVWLLKQPRITGQFIFNDSGQHLL